MKLLFLLLFLSLAGKERSYNGISYRNLSWTDFRGKVPKTDQDLAALTTCQMILVWEQVDDWMTYRVTAYFLPDSSYVREKSDAALRHEQTHFQIAYIHSLRCMVELGMPRYRDSSAKKEALKFFNSCSAQRNVVNEQFDEETNHGLDREAEKEWEARISMELSNLEASIKSRHLKSP